MKKLINRIKYIRNYEGWSGLVGRIFDFLTKRLLVHGHYYLIENQITDIQEEDFLPRIQDYSFQIVATIEAADELVSKGFDFYSISLNTRERIEKGAIAFCILVGTDIAHIGWIALNEGAKNSFYPFPIQVDFLNGEACTGGSATMHKYEGKGLMTFGLYKRLEFLRKRGISKSRNILDINNIATLKISAKFPHKVCAKVHYLKLLWWRSWKETSLNSK